MKIKSPKIFILLAIIVLLTGGLRLTYACGPFTRYAIFSFSKHPDFPLNKYAQGELGIIEDGYARSYLFVAYRLMKGTGFNQQEQQALTRLWSERLDFSIQNEARDNSIDEWLAARKKVMGAAGAEPRIEVWRETAPKEYSYFYNCPSDAFRNATKTLEARITKFGAGSPEVKAWTEAQDAVFANCNEGQTIPAEAQANSSPIIQSDRAYQIAAAHFYSMNFDEARARFEKIAADNSSEWREQAGYLVARSLIRKASLGPEESRKESLTLAETQLKKVLAETTQAALRDSARNLLSLVRMRLHPAERVKELAQSLMQKEANNQLYQDLWDYTILLDKYLGDSDQPVDENLKKALDTAEKDDMTDWILTFESEDKDSLGHALAKWEKSASLPWLITSLSKIEAGHTKAASLISAAERVEPSSPAYATAQYHMIRLLVEKNERGAARAKLDALLSGQNALPASATNHFRHQRMMLANDLEDFLKYAQRQPSAFSWDDDGRENAIDIKEDEELRALAGRNMFDNDAAHILNERFPLSMLREAAMSRTLPDYLRRQVALAAWTRAAILDDVENSKALAPIVSALAPELKSNMDGYLAATTPAQRKSEALYTILKFPGLQTLVTSNVGRLTPLGERDIYRDNWWCAVVSDERKARTDESGESTEGAKQAPAITERAELSFISDAQKAEAARERARLIQLGTAPNYLARETIEWATRTPNDPRVPEALHIAITATRYGCTDKETGKWSKAAFELLHKRYPKSVWAKKTPYWFNNG